MIYAHQKQFSEALDKLKKKYIIILLLIYYYFSGYRGVSYLCDGSISMRGLKSLCEHKVRNNYKYLSFGPGFGILSMMTNQNGTGDKNTVM